MNDRFSSARARPRSASHPHPPAPVQNERDPARNRFPRWLRLHPLLFGLCALLWIVLRSGRKPTRLLYPCQRAALGTATLTLGLPVASAVAGASAAVKARTGLGAALAAALAVGIGGLALSGHIPATTGRVTSAASLIPGIAGGAVPATPSAETISKIYVVEHAAGPQGTHHGGLDALIGCLGGGGFKFYRSPATGPESGPDGIVGAGDLVLIKINQQWGERGGTNTDVLKGLITRIIEHPDGFAGEVVVIENTQGVGTLDWPNSNAEDHSQSALDVIHFFADQGWPVSGRLLDDFRTTSVAEYSAGDLRDGYVVGPLDPGTQIRVSYPKFCTAEGAYVSLEHGIWDPGAGTYDDTQLTFLNVPILKCHGAVYGVTACVKHHVGTMTTALSTNTHNAVRYGGLGTFLAEVRMPDLNILDAIYILAHPSGGPWCTYAEATPTNKLVAGFDPVAIDMWATKNILVPAIIANGYSSYPMQNPDDPQSIFRRYLDLSMSELIAAGIQVTNDLTQIDAQVCQGAGIEPEESSPSSPPVVPHPNPGRSGRAITFDMPIASAVELDIYDARGRLVRSIRESVLQGPRHEIRWDGRDHRGNRLPAGTYIYRLRGGAEPATGKVTLVN